MSNLSTEQEAQKYYYHSMLRAMGEDRCLHRPPSSHYEELIAQDNAREQAKRIIGPGTFATNDITEKITKCCEKCGSTENLKEKRVIYAGTCYNRSKIVFYRCLNCGG